MSGKTKQIQTWLHLSFNGPVYWFNIELGPGGRWFGLHIGEKDA